MSDLLERCRRAQSSGQQIKSAEIHRLVTGILGLVEKNREALEADLVEKFERGGQKQDGHVLTWRSEDKVLVGSTVGHLDAYCGLCTDEWALSKFVSEHMSEIQTGLLRGLAKILGVPDSALTVYSESCANTSVIVKLRIS